MLTYIKKLYGSKLNATDGDIGTVEDFYFDDQSWSVRYLIAETGSWLNERQVLISPYSIDRLDMDDKLLIVNLTRKQIEDSPPIESHKPISRQFEQQYHTYYGWPYYGAGDAILGMGGISTMYPTTEEERKAEEEQHLRDDPHLRSTLDVAGYEIEASDGSIGHITDFLVDDKTWAIKDLVVETGHWYSGKEIRIPIGKINSISYNDSKVYVYLTKDDVEKTGEHHIVHTHRQ